MALGAVSPFRATGTVALNASTGSSSVALSTGGESVVVTNTTDTLAYVRFGADPTVSAGMSDMPVLPNSHVILCINTLVRYAAGILMAGTGSILFTRGDGSVV